MDGRDLHHAVVAWLAAITDPGSEIAFAPDAVTRVPEWAVVVDWIAAVATPERRPELWSEPNSGEPRLHVLDRFGHFTGRPELKIWRPLLTLMLWRREVVCVEASWAVEPRRQIDVLHNDAMIGYFGQEAVERHQRGSYEAFDDPTVNALAAFTRAVDGCVANVLRPVSGRKTPARARRLQRSAEHLVRASQRSFHAGEPRDEGERDEILLHYVIAIEALLAAKEEELTRRVTQRAGALFPTDDDRLFVEDTVKQAYANRSLYAHGDETKDYDLERIREVALAVALRWIVLQAAEPDAVRLLPQLDRSLLSEGVRRAQVVEPLEAFLDGLVVPLRTRRS